MLLLYEYYLSFSNLNEIGQMVLKWLIIKNLFSYRVCHFHVKLNQEKLIATPVFL